MAAGEKEPKGPARMIEASSLSKNFGPIVAVDDISFTVGRGEVLGFLGPNGAGKSTTMKMVTGFLAPSGGTATVCGFDVVERPIEVKRRVGYLPEGAPAYSDMTPEMYLRFVAEVRGFRGADRGKRAARAVELTRLAEVLHQPIDTLSKGYKRRVGLAQALLHDPEVLILDEPTDGLDPNQKHEVRNLIRDMAAEKTIVISTHILEEVDAVCTRAIIIAEGRIVADGTPEELQLRSRHHNAVTVGLPADAAGAAAAALEKLAGVAAVERASDAGGRATLIVFPKDGQPVITEVGAAIRAGGWEVEELHSELGRLDEVFREITQAAS